MTRSCPKRKEIFEAHRFSTARFYKQNQDDFMQFVNSIKVLCQLIRFDENNDHNEKYTDE